MTGPKSPRYVIEKDDENETDCHGAELTGYCPAHKVYGDHVRYETLWTVWDSETGTHAPGEPFMFERRKDAVEWLARHLATPDGRGDETTTEGYPVLEGTVDESLWLNDEPAEAREERYGAAGKTEGGELEHDAWHSANPGQRCGDCLDSEQSSTVEWHPGTGQPMEGIESVAEAPTCRDCGLTAVQIDWSWHERYEGQFEPSEAREEGPTDEA